MKTNTIRNIFVLSIILIFVVACRYEDGPLISLRSSEKRLVGTWRVTGFEKNGVSVLDEWRSQYDWRLTFFGKESDHYFTATNCNCYIDTDDVTLTYASGLWLFYNDNETKLSFKFNFKYYDYKPCKGMGVYPLISGYSLDFDILKLSNSKLWLNSIDSLDNEYFVQFEKE
jgi:hypothetical protein